MSKLGKVRLAREATIRGETDWSGQSFYYRGSIVSFYYSRQATGIYKCCTTVYSPPTRGENFDSDFQSMSTLPPGTPRFTDVNALSFEQALLPNQ